MVLMRNVKIVCDGDLLASHPAAVVYPFSSWPLDVAVADHWPGPTS